MSNYRQFRELEARGIDLVELLGGDRPLEAEEFRVLVSEVKASGEELYSDLLFLLTYRRFSPEEAHRLWRAILKHKRRLAQQLGRDPGVRLSALDYLVNVRGLLVSPRLVDRGDFDHVLSSLHTDELTGLPNRRHMNAAYQLELRRTRRYGKSLTVLLIDIDNFKAVNDQNGHAAGDAVLVEVAKLLREVCRETDTVGRYGGDEFFALLPETRKTDALHLAERVRRVANEREVHLTGGGSGGRPVRFSLSIGLATYPEDSQDADELLRQADQALYEAKARGRNNVSSFDPGSPRRDAPPQGSNPAPGGAP